MQLRGLAQGLVIGHAPGRRVILAEAEAVGEDLVHDAAAEPFRGVKAPLIHGQPEAAALVAHEPADIAGIVRTEPVAAHLGLDTEVVPQGLGLRRGGDLGYIAVPLPRHGIAFAALIAVDHQLRLLHLAAQKAEGKTKGPAAFHSPKGAAAQGEAAVMGHGKLCSRGMAQDADNVGGAGLEGVHVVHVHPGGAQVITAVGRDLIGRVQRHAAVVHQHPHQLRPYQGVAPAIEAFAQPVQGQATQKAVMNCGIAGGAGLKILLYQLLRPGALQQGAELLIAAGGSPAPLAEYRLHHPAVAVGHGHAVVIGPLLPVAAAEINLILQSIHI